MNTLLPPSMRLLSPARGLSFALAAALAAFALAACDSGGSDSTEEADFDRTALLENYGSNLILPAYETLETEIGELDASAQAFVEAPSEATLADVRSDLKAARLAWQDASLYQFGPAGDAALRSALNTYPADEEQISENIAAGEYTLGSIENQDARGFPALGYLLYGEGDALSAYAEGEGAEARAAYLLDNVAFVQENVAQVAEAWSPEGGDYLAEFTSESMAGTDVGSSMGMVINAYVKHYERFLRDAKVGIPAGVRSTGVKRPGAVEAAFGGYSTELAIANLRATQRLYQGRTLGGRDGTGLDDYLRALDAGDLDTEITGEIDQSVAGLQGLSDPLSGEVETSNEAVVEAFQAMQDVVVLLKADMTSVLGVTITFQDNDGD